MLVIADVILLLGYPSDKTYNETINKSIKAEEQNDQREDYRVKLLSAYLASTCERPKCLLCWPSKRESVNAKFKLFDLTRLGAKLVFTDSTAVIKDFDSIPSSKKLSNKHNFHNLFGVIAFFYTCCCILKNTKN